MNRQRPPPPPNAKRPAVGPSDQEDLQYGEGIVRRLMQPPTVRSTAVRGGLRGQGPPISSIPPASARTIYNHGSAQLPGPFPSGFFGATHGVPWRLNNTRYSNTTLSKPTTSKGVDNPAWQNPLEQPSGSRPPPPATSSNATPLSSTPNASSSYSIHTASSAPGNTSGSSADSPRPAKRRRTQEGRPDQKAQSTPSNPPKKFKDKQSGTSNFMMPKKKTPDEIDSWVKARVATLENEGKVVSNIERRGKSVTVEWHKIPSSASSSSTSLITQSASGQIMDIPRALSPTHDIGPDRVRIPLPARTHQANNGSQDAREKWIAGQLDFLRSSDDARAYRCHDVVNDGTLLVVEFWPIVETSVEEESSTSPLLFSSSSKGPTKETEAPPALEPVEPATTTRPVSRSRAPSPSTASHSSPTSPNSSRRSVPSNSATSVDESSSNTEFAKPMINEQPVVVVKREPSPDYTPDQLSTTRRKIRLLDPPSSRGPAGMQAQRHHLEALPASSSSPQYYHSPEPSQPPPPAPSPASSRAPPRVSPTIHRIDLPPPSSAPTSIGPSTSIPQPGPAVSGPDVGNIMRIVRRTNHQQILLPERSGDSVGQGVLARMLVSPRYILSCARGGQMDFVPRVPPRAPMTTMQSLPTDFGTVTGMALTQEPFIDQAIMVSSGPTVQTSILDFRSKNFDPRHYIFEQHPHQPGGTRCINTLPSASASDVGIHFVTGDSYGEVFRWVYEQGNAMRVESLSLPDEATSVMATQHAPVKTLMWGPGRSKLWLGVDVGTNGLVKEWDLSEGACALSGKVQLGAPVQNLLQLSAHVVLAEVEDPDMQFVVHDWRTPRAAQRFGYDHYSGMGTYFRGDVKGHLFARGDKHGVVRVWDIRNLDGYQSLPLSPGDCITQVAFDPFAEGHERLVSLLGHNELMFTTLLRT